MLYQVPSGSKSPGFGFATGWDFRNRLGFGCNRSSDTDIHGLTSVFTLNPQPGMRKNAGRGHGGSTPARSFPVGPYPRSSGSPTARAGGAARLAGNRLPPPPSPAPAGGPVYVPVRMLSYRAGSWEQRMTSAGSERWWSSARRVWLSRI